MKKGDLNNSNSFGMPSNAYNAMHIELMNRKTAQNGILGLLKTPGGVRGGMGVRVSCGYQVGLFEPLLL